MLVDNVGNLNVCKLSSLKLFFLVFYLFIFSYQHLPFLGSNL